MSSSPAAAHGFANPFPATANASGAAIDPDSAVQTEAVQTATSIFHTYLRPSRPDSAGDVLAVIGSAGSGKTYLTGVLRGIAREAAPPAPSAYLSVSETSFAGVLATFVRTVRRDGDTIRNGLRHMYARVVARALHGSGLGRQVGPELLSGQIDPVELVQRMRLDRTTFLEELNDELEELTDHPGIATALTLLLRPGFDDAVWSWLACEEPSGLLRDRRITTPMSTDADALLIMGSLIRIACMPDRKFLLVLDELDRAFVRGRAVTQGVTTALRRFFTTTVQSGAFAVLAGQPSFLDAFPDDARDRIGSTIQTSPFREKDINELIEKHQEGLRGATAPPPFSASVVRYLADLTGGLPRLIVDLCHRLVGVTPPEALNVDEEAIYAATEAYVQERHGSYFSEEVHRALTENGWIVKRDIYPGENLDSHVDFWVTDSLGSESCAILVADNILEARDIDQLRRRILTVKGSTASTEVLLVVKGFLSRASAAELTELVGTPPLLAQPGRTTDDLRKAVGRILSDASKLDPVARVSTRIARLTAQQATTHGYVAQIALAMDELRTANHKQLEHVIGRLDDLRPAKSSMPPAALPPAVEAIFDDALRVLNNLLARVDSLFADALQVPPDRARDTRMALRARLRHANAALPAGVVVMLQRLVGAFRDALGRWYQAGVHADTVALNELCMTYSAACEYLPLFQLDELRLITTRSTMDPDEASTVAPSELRASELFGNLAGRVQAELVAPTAIHRS
jgi:hypothetical protein